MNKEKKDFIDEKYLQTRKLFETLLCKYQKVVYIDECSLCNSINSKKTFPILFAIVEDNYKQSMVEHCLFFVPFVSKQTQKLKKFYSLPVTSELVVNRENDFIFLEMPEFTLLKGKKKFESIIIQIKCNLEKLNLVWQKIKLAVLNAITNKYMINQVLEKTHIWVIYFYNQEPMTLSLQMENVDNNDVETNPKPTKNKEISQKNEESSKKDFQCLQKVFGLEAVTLQNEKDFQMFFKWKKNNFLVVSVGSSTKMPERALLNNFLTPFVQEKYDVLIFNVIFRNKTPFFTDQKCEKGKFWAMEISNCCNQLELALFSKSRRINHHNIENLSTKELENYSDQIRKHRKYENLKEYSLAQICNISSFLTANKQDVFCFKQNMESEFNKYRLLFVEGYDQLLTFVVIKNNVKTLMENGNQYGSIKKYDIPSSFNILVTLLISAFVIESTIVVVLNLNFNINTTITNTEMLRKNLFKIKTYLNETVNEVLEKYFSSEDTSVILTSSKPLIFISGNVFKLKNHVIRCFNDKEAGSIFLNDLFDGFIEFYPPVEETFIKPIHDKKKTSQCFINENLEILVNNQHENFKMKQIDQKILPACSFEYNFLKKTKKYKNNSFNLFMKSEQLFSDSKFKIELSTTKLVFDDIRYMEKNEKSFNLLLKTISGTEQNSSNEFLVCSFKCLVINIQNTISAQEEKILTKQELSFIKCEPLHGMITSSVPFQKITVTVCVTEQNAKYLLKETHSIDLIIVINVCKEKEYFVTVRVNFLPSRFAIPLEDQLLYPFKISTYFEDYHAKKSMIHDDQDQQKKGATFSREKEHALENRNTTSNKITEFLRRDQNYIPHPVWLIISTLLEKFNFKSFPNDKNFLQLQKQETSTNVRESMIQDCELDHEIQQLRKLIDESDLTWDSLEMKESPQTSFTPSSLLKILQDFITSTATCLFSNMIQDKLSENFNDYTILKDILSLEYNIYTKTAYYLISFFSIVAKNLKKTSAMILSQKVSSFLYGQIDLNLERNKNLVQATYVLLCEKDSKIKPIKTDNQEVKLMN